MADLQTPNQAKVEPRLLSDRLIAEGVVVPFERLKWTDFALETRLRALRLILNEIAMEGEAERIEVAQIVELQAA